MPGRLPLWCFIGASFFGPVVGGCAFSRGVNAMLPPAVNEGFANKKLNIIREKK